MMARLVPIGILVGAGLAATLASLGLGEAAGGWAEHAEGNGVALVATFGERAPMPVEPPEPLPPIEREKPPPLPPEPVPPIEPPMEPRPPEKSPELVLVPPPGDPPKPGPIVSPDPGVNAKPAPTKAPARGIRD